MYVEIKENKLLSWCENPYLDYEFVDIDYFTFNPAKYKVEDGQLVDISQTPEYKLSQFQKAIQYQHDAFNEYAREIVYQIQYNTALSNTTLILNLEEQLQAEQLAVIARINAITEAYNNAST